MTSYDSAVELAKLARERPDSVVYRLWAIHGFGGGDRGDQFALHTEEGILGRVVDEQVVKSAKELSGGRAGIFRVEISDTEAVAGGLSCGGWAEVLVHPGALLPDVTEYANARIPFGFRTELADSGDARVVFAGAVGEEAELLTRGVEGTRIVSHGETQVHIQLFQPTPHLTIVGSGELAEALRAQVQLLGWTFDILPRGPLSPVFGPRDAVVFLTHDHDVATPLLAQLLSTSRVGYVGSLGSRGTQRERLEHLGAVGVDPEKSRAIYGPAGLDLGSRSTSETALSIVAEILAVQRGRSGRHLRESAGPING